MFLGAFGSTQAGWGDWGLGVCWVQVFGASGPGIICMLSDLLVESEAELRAAGPYLASVQAAHRHAEPKTGKAGESTGGQRLD